MKTVCFFSIILWLCMSQKAGAQHYRVLYTGSDLNQPDSSDSIRSISSSEASNLLKILYRDGRRIKISTKTVWGYTDNRNHIYRFYRGKTYKVTALGETIKYEREEQRFVGKPVYVGNFTVKYQSHGLDGEVHSD